ncbi:hypothetical protein QWI17_02275 [Gilvimarinus sp. SDUM040013]|uniref:Lipocalin-like domain-containing protein n=1 Tax=Gilvimarinus gilvus TaxID=3058038 RepID=A0ABU4RZD0_9GAMM|nr:hypothetical protein [Gilvimarinus sp. SDUM040013]MDO3384658.1 hypothetical protein [Gilvimarinus sp. SDUM040013]MDX6850244.1 hypothetical protein [Gilvimarinus sp. SDUM040013]
MTKLHFSWFIFTVFILFSSWSAAQDAPDTLAGTWELVDGWVITKDEEIKYDIDGIRSRKMLNGTDFAFVSKKQGEFWAASTGEYQIVGNQYTEIPQLLSYDVAEGTTYVFSFRLEGDDWYTERKEDGKVVEREHWRRIR